MITMFRGALCVLLAGVSGCAPPTPSPTVPARPASAPPAASTGAQSANAAPAATPSPTAGAPDARQLVASLELTEPTDNAAFARSKKVLGELDRLNDPRAADALAAYAPRAPHPYFETRAALALAALGDSRAVPFLARRLTLDPLRIY